MTDTDDVMGRIREVGGQLVILDSDLADLYGVTRGELRAIVRQNKAVFAVQFVVSVRLDGARGRILAFTEHGVIIAGIRSGMIRVRSTDPDRHIVRCRGYSSASPSPEERRC